MRHTRHTRRAEAGVVDNVYVGTFSAQVRFDNSDVDALASRQGLALTRSRNVVRIARSSSREDVIFLVNLNGGVHRICASLDGQLRLCLLFQGRCFDSGTVLGLHGGRAIFRLGRTLARTHRRQRLP